MLFKLPELNYSYNDLEPHFDARTMEIHYSKHHAGYTNNLNNAIQGTEYENLSIEQILKSPNLPIAIRNNGGGYYNHRLFWSILSPSGGGIPTGKLKQEIDDNFSDFEKMKEDFMHATILI